MVILNSLNTNELKCETLSGENVIVNANRIEVDLVEVNSELKIDNIDIGELKTNSLQSNTIESTNFNSERLTALQTSTEQLITPALAVQNFITSNEGTIPELKTDSLISTSAQLSDISCELAGVNQTHVQGTVFSSSGKINGLLSPLQTNANNLSTENLSAGVLNTTNASIATLFANQIGALNEVKVTEVKIDRPNSGLANLKKAMLIIGIVLAVAAVVAIGVCTFGVGVAASLTATSMAAITPGAASIAGIGALIGGQATLAGALAVASVSVPLSSLILSAGMVGAYTAFAAVPTLVVSTIIPQSDLPNERAISMNASFGKGFISDSIFGTTLNYNHAAPYTTFLLIQNSLKTGYALPRILSYNPLLLTYDDSNQFGNSIAYLSLATGGSPTYTLRFQEDGNLAIYDAVGNSPIWQSGTQVSSIKYKKNIEIIKDPVTKLKTLDGVRFKYKDNKPTVGLIAQQLKEVLPEAVFGTEEEGYRVRLERTVPLIIEAMKEIYNRQEVELSSLR